MEWAVNEREGGGARLRHKCGSGDLGTPSKPVFVEVEAGQR